MIREQIQAAKAALRHVCSALDALERALPSSGAGVTVALSRAHFHKVWAEIQTPSHGFTVRLLMEHPSFAGPAKRVLEGIGELIPEKTEFASDNAWAGVQFLLELMADGLNVDLGPAWVPYADARKTMKPGVYVGKTFSGGLAFFNADGVHEARSSSPGVMAAADLIWRPNLGPIVE